MLKGRRYGGLGIQSREIQAAELRGYGAGVRDVFKVLAVVWLWIWLIYFLVRRFFL